jgi:hypothetical protein
LIDVRLADVIRDRPEGRGEVIARQLELAD